MQHKQRMSELDLRAKMADHQVKMATTIQQGKANMAMKGEQHKQSMEQAKEKQALAKSKPVTK